MSTVTEADSIDPRAFIMRTPDTVADVCAKYNLHKNVRRFVKQEGEETEEYIDEYTGVFPTRKLWVPPTGWATDETRVRGTPYHSIGIYLYVQHHVTPEQLKQHEIKIYMNKRYDYHWRGSTNTEGEMAALLQAGFFETLDQLCQHSRAFTMTELFNLLRRKKLIRKY